MLLSLVNGGVVGSMKYKIVGICLVALLLFTSFSSNIVSADSSNLESTEKRNLVIDINVDESLDGIEGKGVVNVTWEEGDQYERINHTEPPLNLEFDDGEYITVVAYGKVGFEFNNWHFGGSDENDDDILLLTMDKDREFASNFTIRTYDLDITAIDGDVEIYPDQDVYEHGEEVTIKATPKRYYIWDGWSGDVESSDRTIDIVMENDVELEAEFVRDELSMTILLTAFALLVIVGIILRFAVVFG